MKRDYLFACISISVVFIDQLTKIIVRRFFPGDIPVISNIFHINYVRNTGAGFSLFRNLNNSNTMLIFTTILIIGVILVNYDKIENNLFPFVALIVGGAFGNLIDRIYLGYVVDFLDFKIWPVFNIADSAISIAGVFILINLLKSKKTS